MKKILSIALMLCLILGLCACGSADETATTTEGAPAVTDAVTEAVEPADETEAAAEGMVTYTVTVVDEEGNPIAGAMVQLCLDACIPGVTNEAGVAEFTLAEADYKVSFLTVPAGYTAEAENFYFENGSTEITLTLKAEG